MQFKEWINENLASSGGGSVAWTGQTLDGGTNANMGVRSKYTVSGPTDSEPDGKVADFGFKRGPKSKRPTKRTSRDIHTKKMIPPRIDVPDMG